MLAIHTFGTYPEYAGIENTHPAMILRIRRAADTMTCHEIEACLARAILDAADAAHLCAFEETEFGSAGADAIVDAEYHDDLAAAWSLVAAEHQLLDLESLCAVH